MLGQTGVRGDLMSYTARAALLAAAIILSQPASAADLGGNCCADLKSDIAELEATTARRNWSKSQHLPGMWHRKSHG